MKKLLFLIIVLCILPFNTFASSYSERNVQIDFVIGDNLVQSDIKFRLKKDNQYIDNIVYSSSNNGIFKDSIQLETGSYQIEILDLPDNYVVHNTTFNVIDSNINHKVYFSEKTGGIEITRKGIFNINGIEYESLILQNVIYEIYALEDINNLNGNNYAKDDLVTTLTTNNGKASTNLSFGKYYIVEKSVDDFYKSESVIELSIDIDHLFNGYGIHTLHRPLKVETNVDYKLCSEESFSVIDDSFNQIEIIKKGDCFINNDYYYLPYGKYKFVSESFNKEINFNEFNDYFEYFKEEIDDTNEQEIEEQEVIENEEFVEQQEETIEETTNLKQETIDENKEKNEEKEEQIDITQKEENISSEQEDVKKQEVIDNKNDLILTTNKFNVDDKLIEQNKMPITSSRSNKCSLLFSGIILIIFSIFKK